MGMHGCGRCIKYVVFIFNALILVGGIAVLGVGIWTCIDKGYFEKLLGSDLYMSSAYILIAMGATIIVISFIGCLGAVKEIKCLLLTYFITLFLIFVVLLIGGILGYVFKSKVKETARNVMLTTLKEDYKKKPFVTQSWDQVQELLRCCGMKIDKNESYSAWTLNEEFQQKKLYDPRPEVPHSCCIRDDTGKYLDEKKCLTTKPSKATVYTTDCLEALLAHAAKHAVILGGVGIGIAILMFLGIIFSFILFKLIE